MEYVRRLPAGQHASDEARHFAESIGLELEPNETYVQPFMRQSWVLREV